MSKEVESPDPEGELIIRTLAMPENTNPAGDIFGGWLLAEMDIAGGLVAKKIAKGRTVTLAVDSMIFLKPVSVGDALCCYVSVVKTGRTSITLKVEAWVTREYKEGREKVTEGVFTYVAVRSDRQPRAITEKYT